MPNSRRTFSFAAAVALTLALLAGCASSRPLPDISTPQKAFAAFADALAANDMDMAKLLSNGSIDDLASAKFRSDLMAAMTNLNAALKKQFGPTAMMPGTATLKDDLAAATLKVDGTTATFISSDLFFGTIRLTQTGNDWKVDLSSFHQDKPVSKVDESNLQVLDTMTQKIAAGTFKTAAEAEAEMNKESSAADAQAAADQLTADIAKYAIDASTPKKAVLEFISSVDSGNMDRARVVALGSDDNLAYTAAKRHYLVAMKQYLQAEMDHFHSQDDVELDDPGDYNADTEISQGQNATLVTPAGKTVFSLKQTPPIWKVDLTNITKTDDPGSLNDQAQAAEALTKDIQSGKFSSSDQASDSFSDQTDALADARVMSSIAPAPSTSPTDWANQYFEIPWTPQGTLLKQVHAVRVDVMKNNFVSSRVTSDELFKIVDKVANSRGLVDDPYAPVGLTVYVDFYDDEFTSTNSRTNQITARYPVFSDNVSIGIDVSTICYRNGQFVPEKVVPIVGRYSETGTGTVDHDYILKNFETNLGKAFDAAATNTAAASTDTEQSWQKSRWSTDRDADMMKAFTTAAHTPAGTPLKVFQGVTGMFTNVDSAGKFSSYGNMQTVLSEWETAMKKAGLDNSSPTGITMHDEVSSDETSMSSLEVNMGIIFDPSNLYDTDWDLLEVMEPNVVFSLNGQLYRGSARIWYQPSCDFSLRNANAKTLSDLLSDDMTIFVKAAADR
jgi:outer membrane murein-binding lipoprotein Lpp